MGGTRGRVDVCAGSRRSTPPRTATEEDLSELDGTAEQNKEWHREVDVDVRRDVPRFARTHGACCVTQSLEGLTHPAHAPRQPHHHDDEAAQRLQPAGGSGLTRGGHVEEGRGATTRTGILPQSPGSPKVGPARLLRRLRGTSPLPP